MLELAKLQNAKPNGSKIIARCPVCASQGQDKKSDHLAYWTDKETYHCIAGCDTKEIFSLVGIPKEREPKPKKRRIVATYDYTNAQGELIHQSIKYDPKGYGQRRPDGKGGWIWKMAGVTTVLYNLPKLAEDAPDKPVWIVEGEKDADTLTKAGHIATTCPMGAGKWKDHYNVHLKRRHVIACSDNDKPGLAHTLAVAQSLKDTAASVRTIDIKEAWTACPVKGDVSDYVAAGGDLDALMTQAREYVEAPSLTSHDQGDLRPISGAEFMAALQAMDSSEPDTLQKMKDLARDAVFIFPKIACTGDLTIINAKYNTGKTLLALWLLSRRDMEATKDFEIFYVNADDSINSAIEKIELMQSVGVRTLIPSHGGFDNSKLGWILQTAIETDSAPKIVIILDTLKKFVDTMNKKEAREINLLFRSFSAAGGTVIALAHTNKHKVGGESVAEGVGDFLSDFDCGYLVDAVEPTPADRKTVVFKNQKLRGPNAKEVHFTYDNSEGRTWMERYESIDQIANDHAKSIVADQTAEEKHKDDTETIIYLEKRIYESDKPVAETKLTQSDLLEHLPSRRERERILVLYSDANPREDHQHWKRRSGSNRGFVYSRPEAHEPF
jgi:hypothetical protein